MFTLVPAKQRRLWMYDLGGRLVSFSKSRDTFSHLLESLFIPISERIMSWEILWHLERPKIELICTASAWSTRVVGISPDHSSAVYSITGLAIAFQSVAADLGRRPPSRRQIHDKSSEIDFALDIARVTCWVQSKEVRVSVPRYLYDCFTSTLCPESIQGSAWTCVSVDASVLKAMIALLSPFSLYRFLKANSDTISFIARSSYTLPASKTISSAYIRRGVCLPAIRMPRLLALRSSAKPLMKQLYSPGDSTAPWATPRDILNHSVSPKGNRYLLAASKAYLALQGRIDGRSYLLSKPYRRLFSHRWKLPALVVCGLYGWE